MWTYHYSDAQLEHHGILGMKWGVRRYQNADGSLTSAGKKRYIKNMQRDQSEYFKRRISKEAAKVTSIGRNGYDSRGKSWGDAYRAKKVTDKDDAAVKRAAKETRAYMKEKYGESAVKALARSGVLGRPIGDFDIKVPLGATEKAVSALSKTTVSEIRSSNSNYVGKTPKIRTNPNWKVDGPQSNDHLDRTFKNAKR